MLRGARYCNDKIVPGPTVTLRYRCHICRNISKIISWLKCGLSFLCNPNITNVIQSEHKMSNSLKKQLPKTTLHSIHVTVHASTQRWHFYITRKPSYRWQTRATRKPAKNCSNSTCLQRCRWQYWPIFIRLAVLESEICEIPRNSLKIQTHGVQGHPRSSILVSIESPDMTSY